MEQIMKERGEKATGCSSGTGDADIAGVGSSETPKIAQEWNCDLQCTKNPRGCLLMGRADIRGEAAPTIQENKVQPQHVCTLDPASWGSGAAKTPMQSLTCLSLLLSARPAIGLVVLSLR